MVLVSALFAGTALHSRLKKRREFLHEILVFISMMKIEFEFMAMPVFRVLEKLYSSGSCRSLDFVSLCMRSVQKGDDFSEAWRNSVENSCLPMKKEEREKLSAMGSLLGTSDIKGQLSMLTLFYESFLAYRKKADNEYEKYGRLCITVSAIVGTGVFIFLM